MFLIMKQSSPFFLRDQKVKTKKTNYLENENNFQTKQKEFIIIFKGLSLKQSNFIQIWGSDFKTSGSV